MELNKLQKIIADHKLFLKSNGKEGKKAVLGNSNMNRAELENTDLQNSDLSNVNLSNANLSGAILNNADLSNADLSGANLEGASLISADLTDADLSNSNLAGSILRGATLNSTQLNNADLTSTDMTNISLNSSDMISANLNGADLSNSDLNTANMTRADCTDAKLCNAEFYDAVLRNTNLSGSDLSNADLSNADLSNADLSRAILKNAALHDTDLSNVNLSNADLTEADLCGSVLFEAVLRNTIMSSAKFDERTIFGYTVISNVDLSSVDSLSYVLHIAPSSIGIDTIVASKGRIDKGFLSGAGCPKNILEYFDSYIHNPINSYKCLISFSDEDEEFAKKIKADLETNKIRCWAIPEELKIGDEVRELILNNIASYNSLILVLSEKSIHSGWIEEEVRKAMQIKKGTNSTRLFPLRLDDTLYVEDYDWIDEFRGVIEIGDFTNWTNPHEYEKSFEILLKELKAASER